MTSTATLQAWANRGTFRLPEVQRDPGVGKKRLYTTLDVACLVAIKTLTGFGLSATAAAQIVQRLQNKRKRLQYGGRRSNRLHAIFIFSCPKAKLGRSFGRASTPAGCRFVVEGLNNSSGAAVFDVGPPIARTMEALRGRQSAEVFRCPGLGGSQPEAPQHRAASPPTAPPYRPFIAGEYPKYKYHKGRKTIVKDADAEAALGEAWQDLPV